jgi:tetratricopeptide (TPR) repeat protein
MKQPTAIDRRRCEDERAPIRERWTAQSPGASDEAIAGAMLRSAAWVRPLGAKEMAEVGVRLRSKERFRPRPRALQLAVAASLVLFGGALWAAVSHVLRSPSHDKRELPRVAPAIKPARHASLGSSRPASQISPPPAKAPSPPALAPPATRPVVMRPNRVVANREELAAVAPPPFVEPRLAPPPADSPSSLAQESRILARAIAELRQEGDAEQALAILDQHRAEFGTSGALTTEANATRIEALLQLGRHGQALALLDGQALNATGVGREMLVARAELRADKGRRASALHDFDLLLRADAPPDSVTERSLYGRAVCRGRMGKWEEARRDFERYLATFPNGKFANQVRAALNQ